MGIGRRNGIESREGAATVTYRSEPVLETQSYRPVLDIVYFDLIYERGYSVCMHRFVATDLGKLDPRSLHLSN